MKNVSEYEDSTYLLNHPEKLKLKADNEGYLFFRRLLGKKTNMSLLRDLINVCSKHGFLENNNGHNSKKAKKGIKIEPLCKEDIDYYKDVLKLRSLHAYAQSKEIIHIPLSLTLKSVEFLVPAGIFKLIGLSNVLTTTSPPKIASK